MPPDDRWLRHAEHILAEIGKIRRLLAGAPDAFDDDDIQTLIRHRLQTLCESTSHLPDALKDAFPAIPWRKIKNFRNIMAHDYLGDIIDDAVVREIIERDLEPLRQAVQAMLDGAGRGSKI